jgi:hypothetical protein
LSFAGYNRGNRRGKKVATFFEAARGIFVILILLGLGYALARGKWIKKEESEFLARLVVYVALPPYMVVNITANFTNPRHRKSSRSRQEEAQAIQAPKVQTHQHEPGSTHTLFNEKHWEVSVSTVAGRLKLLLAIGNFQRGLLKGHKPTSATLSYNRRTKDFYIHIAVEREIPFPVGNGEVMGIDRGIYNLATTSNGLKFSGRQAMHVRRRYARLHQALQAKGTKGAKRTLKRLSGKERRFMADLNHRIAKAIVWKTCGTSGSEFVWPESKASFSIPGLSGNWAGSLSTRLLNVASR